MIRTIVMLWMCSLPLRAADDPNHELLKAADKIATLAR